MTLTQPLLSFVAREHNQLAKSQTTYLPKPTAPHLTKVPTSPPLSSKKITPSKKAPSKMSNPSNSDEPITLANLHLILDAYNQRAEHYQRKPQPRGPPPRIPLELEGRFPEGYIPRHGQVLPNKAREYLRMNFDEAPRVAPHVVKEISIEEARRRRRSEIAGAREDGSEEGLRYVELGDDGGGDDDLAVRAVEKKGCCGGCVVI